MPKFGILMVSSVLCNTSETYYAKQKKPLECKFWHILSAYFITLTNSENLKNGISYIGNHSRKETFAIFADFGMIANLFLLLFSIF